MIPSTRIDVAKNCLRPTILALLSVTWLSGTWLSGAALAQNASPLPPMLPTIDLTDPTTYRSIDGTGNNLDNPALGSANTPLIRLFDADYEDGSTPPGDNRPSTRAVSNAVGEQLENTPSDKGLTALFWSWGQLLAHDITLVPTGDEAFNIPVEPGDFNGEITEIPMSRSLYADGTGTGPDNPRQQINTITSFIDASFVYGSDAVTADLLRRNDGTGLLWEGPGNTLPTNGQLDVDADPTNDHLFVAGDARANEQLALSAMHTIFMREHNRLADHIASTDPTLSGDEIYHMTRLIVGGEVQAITYNEFLPILLGTEDGLAPYEGYDPTVDPSITNEFATSAFRIGHTLLQNDFLLVAQEGGGTIPLADCFFNPACLNSAGLEATILGLGGQDAQIFDSLFVDAVRNQLITGFGVSVGVDLPALNMQRGRDHGLPSYQSARAQLIAMGLIQGTGSIPQELLDIYGDSEVDLFIGGVSEAAYLDALVGEVAQAILKEQFYRLRAGDRFWYQRPGLFAPELVAWLDEITLADILLWNTDLEFFQQYAFFAVDFGMGQAQTLSQLAVAAYLDGMTVDGLDDYALYEVGVQLQAASDVPGALDQVHGEWFNSFTETGLAHARSAMYQISLRLDEAHTGRSNSAFSASGAGAGKESRLMFWIAGQGRFDDVDGNTGFISYDIDTYSGYLGIDYRASDSVLIGVMGGGGSSDIDVDGRAGDNDVDAWQVAAYAAFATGAFYADLSGGFGDLNIQSRRGITFGTINRVASADYDGDFHYINGRAGYRFAAGDWTLATEAALAYAKVKQDGFTETGADNLNLTVNAQSADSLRLQGLLRLSRNLKSGNASGSIIPHLHVGIAHEFEDDLRPITARMEGGTGSFTVFGEVAARTVAVFGAGLAVRLNDTVSLYLDYAGEAGSGYASHTGSGGARVRF
ncbi:MAG: peroxidase family protein [Alphaproteobacteria bacterium]